MKRKTVRKLALALAGASFALSAPAATFEDVQFWVGSGDNRAALVVDWNDSKAPESLLWGYRWDGTATGLDMLEAIVTADPRLYASVSAPGMFGVSVYGIGYDLDGDGDFGVSPALGFDAGGWSVGTADDARVPTDTADHWLEGWNVGFWGYNLKDNGNDPWTSAMTGPADRILTDSAWDGYSFAPGFSFTDPSEPTAALVPEPTTWSLALLGGILLTGLRRNLLRVSAFAEP